jgi:hypothetical protein
MIHRARNKTKAEKSTELRWVCQERLKKLRVEEGAMENYLDAIRDRRATKRFLANAPVLVYGYGATDEPFHERTEALSVNAGGGLITLTTAVNAGQTLLLVNEVNLKQENCTMIRQVSTDLNRTGIVVKFQQPVPDFWDAVPDPP